MTTDAATKHFGTQGDGNHFFYVGRVASTGQVALVTHHGSRKPGALLYKAGMDMAESYRRRLSPETPAHNAWIPSETDDGRAYWEALQLDPHLDQEEPLRHPRRGRASTSAPRSRTASGTSTTSCSARATACSITPRARPRPGPTSPPTSSGLTLIPLNMAEPILIARGLDAENGLGFAPHGAGRNFSRSAYMRRHAGKTEAQMVAEQTKGIDARFFCGIPDVSELPGAYKNAAAVRRQIAEFGLAEIVDTIEPIGCIMAGDWQRDAPWRKKKARAAQSSARGMPMAIVEATAGAIAAAAQALRRGELVAFPTETVYGLGADATNGRAVAAIFDGKGPPALQSADRARAGCRRPWSGSDGSASSAASWRQPSGRGRCRW